MKKYKNWYFVSVLFIVIACSVSFGEEKEVISEGVGDMESVSRASARDAAIDDALRRAVEQVVGTLITSESMVSNYTLLYDRVYSQSSGYVKSYKVLNEEGKDGIYVVRINAKVGTDGISNDLQTIGLLISRKHNPRIMVIIGESIAGSKIEIDEGQSVSETTFIEQFLSKGFKVVDAEMAKKSTERNKLFYALENDAVLAAKIGLQYDAEVIIMGKAIATPKPSRQASKYMEGTNLKTVHANIYARAIRADNAEIIASGSMSGTKLHIDETTGSYKAFQNVGKKLANTIIEKILKKWGDDTNLNTVELTLSGLSSFSDLIKIKNDIKQKLRGVKEIHQRAFTDGVAVLEIKSSGDTQIIAEGLVGQKMNNQDIEVKDITQNKIQAVVKKPIQKQKSWWNKK
ncbi:MAG: hypothetical protein HON76_14855 [Candidatus Scalindua sp.]|jgi:hypothetical protein|nr:hypothetical protein [Candidatus Scalindua sp.]MBT5304313.1 hypothetical protein [Candidatus Scalindua sp.]MBT6045228.1 hypothetical protein [Candidatus Scalindua sp.]MBT6563798.1 hypothetical protein [Candidatus Scalindua sp.]MBT7212146.1 hypothetical protein [Candidatus Scalindua sp.]